MKLKILADFQFYERMENSFVWKMSSLKNFPWGKKELFLSLLKQLYSEVNKGDIFYNALLNLAQQRSLCQPPAHYAYIKEHAYKKKSGSCLLTLTSLPIYHILFSTIVEQ